MATKFNKSKKAIRKKPSSIKRKANNDSACSFPTVGIGASAGGLESFTQLLKELPSDTGMAFVLIQHLDPNHSSLLTEALSKTTKMKVQEIRNGLRILPNEVYVIPPGKDIGFSQGKLKLYPRAKSAGPHLAIDLFFKELSAECGSQSIGIVLSGTGSDGTEGLRAIKAGNGVTFAQDPKTAKFDGMPQSAVNAEVVDFSLPIPELVQELVRLAHHPYVAGNSDKILKESTDEENLQKIFVLLRASVGIDFSEYKPPTIKRRLARRMALLKTTSLKAYLRILQSNPEEIKLLASDALIHVTSFFRDPDVYKKLQTTVFPNLIKKKGSGSPIRIWVTGCSSGEEIYSIAISLLEFLGDRASKFPIQMFGSDISERMIDKARNGTYSENALQEVNPARLKQYFLKCDGGYRINKTIRDLCVFVRHDLARDPPFSKLDLVTCRNVLIYFEPILQKRIISIFHYCLNQPGFLLLGRTESISNYQHLFSTMDKKNKIFKREAVTSQLRFATLQNSPPEKPSKTHTITPALPVMDIAKQIDSLLLTRYAPAGVVINEKMEVIQYRGKTSPYFEPPPGQPQLNIFKMVREGLFSALKITIAESRKKMTLILKEGIQFKQNGVTRVCNLVVVPVAMLPNSKEPLFLVLFEDVPVPKQTKVIKGKTGTKLTQQKESSAIQRAAILEHELRATQEYLQALNEEHQKTNDSLNSVNQEFVSGNEELQSMNEELETAKEELQSINEELTTVNDELQTRNLETAEVNDDLINLLNSSEIPILILDEQRRIRRFTPKARAMMNLLPTDIGRQINDIKPNINIKKLDEKIQEVIETVQIKEVEVQDREGKWYRVQIRPYKTIDNKIAGAILSLTNIDVLKRAVINAEWVRDYSANIVEGVQTPLLVLDEQFSVLSANQAYYDDFQVSKNETEGKKIYETSLGSCGVEELKKSLIEMIDKKSTLKNMHFKCELPSGSKIMCLTARQIPSIDGELMILLSIEDITERNNREKDRKVLLDQTEIAKKEAEKANLTKDLFLATLSHELRTPLTSLLMQAQMLERGGLDEAKVKKACRAIIRAAQTQTQLIEDLLDVSRIVAGKLQMEVQPVNLIEVIRAAVETVSVLAESKSISIEENFDESIGLVSGDPIRLQQIVWNLLTNAIKFTTKGDKILITLKGQDDKVQIQVIDYGIGITPEFLPKVFNRFTQAENTNTRLHGGLGLGLAIVRHLVEMHYGTVKVDSAGQNKGSTFTVILPLIKIVTADDNGKKTNSSVSIKASSKKLRAINLKGIKILLVEDDNGAREAISDMLSMAGADVRSSASANDAMEMLKEFTPDKLVLDIAMPGENGYSLLKRIRKFIPRNIPAMALTALANDKDREEAFSAGFQMHLTKPVDIDRLTNALIELKDQNHFVHNHLLIH